MQRSRSTMTTEHEEVYKKKRGSILIRNVEKKNKEPMRKVHEITAKKETVIMAQKKLISHKKDTKQGTNAKTEKESNCQKKSKKQSQKTSLNQVCKKGEKCLKSNKDMERRAQEELRLKLLVLQRQELLTHEQIIQELQKQELAKIQPTVITVKSDLPSDTGSKLNSEEVKSEKNEDIENNMKLMHFQVLSHKEFETDFRKWMKQEEIEHLTQDQLRTELINTFNATRLGQELLKMCSAGKSNTHSPQLSSLLLSLNTLVAEFLYTQNSRFTLSVFCSEMPYPNALPDFAGREPFRFTKEELLQVLSAISGFQLETPPMDILLQKVQTHYNETGQSLLFAMIKFLVDALSIQNPPNINCISHVKESQHERVIEPKSLKVDNAESENSTNVMQMHLTAVKPKIAPPCETHEKQNILMMHSATMTESAYLHPIVEEQLRIKTNNDMMTMSSIQNVNSHLQKHMCNGQTQTDLCQINCFRNEPGVDFNQLLQADDFIISEDGQTVFTGSKVTQTIRNIEKELDELFPYMQELANTCTPPKEVVLSRDFESMLRQEMEARERLEKNGQPFAQGQLALPELVSQPVTVPTSTSSTFMSYNAEFIYVESPAGLIQAPTTQVSLPKLPGLHPEQLACMASVRQAMQRWERISRRRHPHVKLISALECLNVIVSDLAFCFQGLSNVLNLVIEQEHGVGSQQGFKRGYKEGFTHGHYMGVQEGRQFAEAVLVVPPTIPELRRADASIQTDPKPTPRRRMTQNVGTSTKMVKLADAMVQTSESETDKSYKEWIYEMLSTSSGQIFLERVELSLNKALDVQKQRLEDLYNIKIRHHAEMLRLDRNQNSWRALCRRMERESSDEAHKVVHKIAHLLSHFESKHRELSERIQKTDVDVRKATHIIPVWGETSEKTPPSMSVASSLKSVESISSSLSTLSNDVLIMHDEKEVDCELQPKSTSHILLAQHESLQIDVICPQQRQDLASTAPACFPHHDQDAVATSESDAAKSNIQTVASNAVIKETLDINRPLQLSFEEALLSAKNRLTDLEQESDLLEQSFQFYLQRTQLENISEPKPPRTTLSTCKQFDKPSNSSFEYECCYREEEAQSRESLTEHSEQQTASSVANGITIVKNCTQSTNPPDSEDKFKFINAITVARRKLFYDLNKLSESTIPLLETQANQRIQDWHILHKNLLTESTSNWRQQESSVPLINVEQLISHVDTQLFQAVSNTCHPYGLSKLHQLLDTPTSSDQEQDQNNEMCGHKIYSKNSIAQQMPHKVSIITSLLENNDDSNSQSSEPYQLSGWEQYAGGGDSLNNPLGQKTHLHAQTVGKGSGDTHNVKRMLNNCNELVIQKDDNYSTPASRKLLQSMTKMQQLFKNQELSEPFSSVSIVSQNTQQTDSKNVLTKLPQTFKTLEVRPRSAASAVPVASSSRLRTQRPESAPDFGSRAKVTAVTNLDKFPPPLMFTRPSTTKTSLLLSLNTQTENVRGLPASDLSSYSNTSDIGVRRASYEQLLHSAMDSTNPLTEVQPAVNHCVISSPELSYSQEFWSRMNM